MVNGISSVNELLHNPSFQRWTEGKASKKEALLWDGWCRKSEYNRQLAIQAQVQLLKIQPVQTYQADTEMEWQKLYEHIQGSSAPRSVPIRNNRVVWWFRIAAVILVSVTAGLFVHKAGLMQQAKSVQDEVIWKQVKTTYGEHKKIMLSDGSSIILGPNSSLKHQEGWVQDAGADIHLSGEAYFDIVTQTPGDASPFQVKTYDGVVQVMGTRFLVGTEEDQTRVVLEEGAVQIIKAKSATDDPDSEKVFRLRPNQLAEFSRAGDSVNIHEVNSQVYTSWIRHKLVLDNSSFRYLVKKIKRSYGVEVEVKDPDLYERRLTGTVNFKNLDVLVKAISEVLEVRVHRSGDKVIFSQ